jgi:A/G-specific adenine glycosylase
MFEPIHPATLARIRRRLLSWYDQHRRDLPWRRTRDPYAVWVSEVMLQQTQAATVIPYYERFMRRFPGVRALARARLDEVLGLWAGLGYYARARHLHAAAREIVAAFGGRLPGNAADLRRLPGMGPYSAGAVASIAFGEPEPVVDGNVTRVLARLLKLEGDVRRGRGARRVWEAARRLLPRSRCGDFNQAMMELGATVCLRGAGARCAACPLLGDCRAAAEGRVAVLPARPSRPPKRRETLVVAAVGCGGRYLVTRRPTGARWGGLWELPTAACPAGRTRAAASRLARDLAGLDGGIDLRRFCRLEVHLTHRELSVHCYHGEVAGRGRRKAGRWLGLGRMASVPMSTAMRRVVAALREHLVAGSAGGGRERRAARTVQATRAAVSLLALAGGPRRLPGCPSSSDPHAAREPREREPAHGPAPVGLPARRRGTPFCVHPD